MTPYIIALAALALLLARTRKKTLADDQTEIAWLYVAPHNRKA